MIVTHTAWRCGARGVGPVLISFLLVWLLTLVFPSAGVGAPPPGEGGSESAARLAGGTWLGYVVSGDTAHDRLTQAGLEGLAVVLRQRTAIEAIGVNGIDLERDDPILLPLLYWAPAPGRPVLSAVGRERLNRFLGSGGLLVIDGGRAGTGGGPGGGAGGPAFVGGLDLPPLVRLPIDHVLTRSFYLLHEFPGRYRAGQVWVGGGNPGLDGVSPVVIGAVDWAGAWAVDAQGQPLHAAVPGGEYQRELAYRFGVNLAIYALTGNYKADQVHVQTILERLGR